MNLEQKAPYHFHKGDLRCGLDDLLDGEAREDAMVQDNLYVVSHGSGNEKLARIMPRRFNQLIPRLKASDYDYIIFDMPPVNQTSVTPQLARYMDMVLMVVESEKTNREIVKRASSLVVEAKSPFGIVMNKTRNYLPRRLREEI
jgi:polysaccharide biosynthesis transport protein